MLNLDYDEMFKISILALKMNRSYPTIPINKIWFLTMIPFFGFFCFIFSWFVYSMLFHDLKNGDFTAACNDGTFAFLFVGVCIPYSVLLMKRQDFVEAIDKVKGDYAAANKLCTDEQDIVSEYANKGSWVTKLWFLVNLLSFSTFPIQIVYFTIYYYAIGDFRLVHLYDMTYPGVLETNKDKTYMYLFLLFSHIYYRVYTVLMFGGFIPLGLIFMLHACGRIEIVKYRISNLFNGEHYDPNEIKQRLKDIVIPLQDVLNFVDLLKETFRVLYEGYIRGTTIVVPIALYEILEAFKEGRVSIECTTFVIAGGVLCFAPCYYSDLLMEKGLSLRMAVYTCGWEKYPDPAMRRTLVIILNRLERDVAIRTLFRTVNLDAFAECNVIRIAIQRGNAASILGTMPQGPVLDLILSPVLCYLQPHKRRLVIVQPNRT